MIKERDGRIPVEISCWIEGPEGVHCVTTFDLSDAGVSVLSSDPAPEGKILTLRFFTPFSVEPITVQGEVIWSQAGQEARMGLKFIGLNEITKGILKSTAQLLRTREQMEKI